ncbi:DUF302 domain-containing protein [Dawidia soli]|uniref:DUF302 domain-containing protein n=1 Tax=Dawidia soli TaxID=2782352 RepID=A0AAP2GHX5_9BACT|nr:DUF302 domain-containing protein [Dawidia soli]MBT1686453.1 DUF302 domain-containing protein [Dawidia soli]
MAYYYSRKLQIPFDEAVQRAIQNLQQQGFGIVTTIDLKETLKQKLNIDFRKYRIIGACNPQFAFQAVSLESHIGLMLPCNVVVQEHENGEVEVSAINPLETIDNITATAQLAVIAQEIGNRLRVAIDTLEHGKPEENLPQALPTDYTSTELNISIPG